MTKLGLRVAAVAATCVIVAAGASALRQTPSESAQVPETPPRGADAVTALFADLQEGWHVGGLRLSTWDEVADESSFAQRPIARNCDRYRKNHAIVVIGEIRGGDFAEVRLEFNRLGDETRPVLGVFAKPAWRRPDSETGSMLGTVPGLREPPPRPRDLNAQLARFGLVLGEPWAFGGDGVMFKTTLEGFYVLVVAGEGGAGPQLDSVVRAFDQQIFDRIDRLPCALFEARYREVVRGEVLDRITQWKLAAGSAADVGVPGPTEIIERVQAETAAELVTKVSAAEHFAGTDWRGRVVLVQELAVAAAQASKLTGGKVDPAAVAALQKQSAQLAAELDDATKTASEAGHELSRRAFTDIARRLRDDCSLGSSVVLTEHLAQYFSVTGFALVVAAHAGDFDTKSLFDQLGVHEQLCDKATSGDRNVRVFADLESELLAEHYEAAAREAAAKNLPATAAARYLIARSILTAGRDPAPAAETLLDARNRLRVITEDRSVLVEMTRQGVLLAARVLPFIHPEGDATYAKEVYADNVLLAGSPLCVKFGLATGTLDDQWRFAAEQEAPLFRFLIDDVMVDVEKVTSTLGADTVDFSIYGDGLPTDPPHIRTWREELNEVQGEIDAAEGRPSRDPRRRSFEWDSDDYVAIRKETMASIKAGLEEADATQKARQGLETLRARRAEIEKRRPFGASVGMGWHRVAVPREIQNWRVPFSRKVRLDRADAKYEFEADSALTTQCYRVKDDAVLGIKGFDGFRTAYQMRDERDSLRSNVRAFAEFGLSSALIQRAGDYERSLDSRDITEQEKMTERRWLRYLLTPAASAVEGTAAFQQKQVIDRASKAWWW